MSLAWRADGLCSLYPVNIYPTMLYPSPNNSVLNDLLLPRRLYYYKHLILVTSCIHKYCIHDLYTNTRRFVHNLPVLYTNVEAVKSLAILNAVCVRPGTRSDSVCLPAGTGREGCPADTKGSFGSTLLVVYLIRRSAGVDDWAAGAGAGNFRVCLGTGSDDVPPTCVCMYTSGTRTSQCRPLAPPFRYV